MKIIRFVLGKVILALDAVFTPSSLVRTPDAQAQVDLGTKNLEIYQLVACPFCVKVRREVKRLGLNITYKNVEDPKNQSDLMAGGKIDQVPCLKLTPTSGQPTWTYESDTIIEYLRTHFAK